MPRDRALSGGPDRRAAPVLAGLAVLLLVAGIGSAAALQRAPAPAAAAQTAVSGAVLPQPRPDRTAGRADAVTALLRSRATAVRTRDRAAYLATVDPEDPVLLRREAAAFDALAAVPIGEWDYRLTDTSGEQQDAGRDARYGSGRWWSPQVQLGYTLQGYDERPTTSDLRPVFVERAAGWRYAGLAGGVPAKPALWDLGPVEAVRSGPVLVLGRPKDAELLRSIARSTAAAVPAVTDVWGPWSERAVVVVPSNGAELGRLLGRTGELSQIAAVATAEIAVTEDYAPAGDRVLINRDTFPTLGPVGRRVVLKHELTHVAARGDTGPATPAWLAEGLADYVGYDGVDVADEVAARELQADVRAGRLPQRLPTDADFDGANPRLSQAYEQSWLAVRLLEERAGEAKVLALYRAVGKARGVSPEEAVEQALASTLGTSTEQLTADWRAYLQRRLG